MTTEQNNQLMKNKSIYVTIYIIIFYNKSDISQNVNYKPIILYFKSSYWQKKYVGMFSEVKHIIRHS